jgi:hypothetical protein
MGMNSGIFIETKHRSKPVHEGDGHSSQVVNTKNIRTTLSLGI